MKDGRLHQDFSSQECRLLDAIGGASGTCDWTTPRILRQPCEYDHLPEETLRSCSFLELDMETEISTKFACSECIPIDHTHQLIIGCQWVMLGRFIVNLSSLTSQITFRSTPFPKAARNWPQNLISHIYDPDRIIVRLWRSFIRLFLHPWTSNCFQKSSIRLV